MQTESWGTMAPTELTAYQCDGIPMIREKCIQLWNWYREPYRALKLCSHDDDLRQLVAGLPERPYDRRDWIVEGSTFLAGFVPMIVLWLVVGSDRFWFISGIVGISTLWFVRSWRRGKEIANIIKECDTSTDLHESPQHKRGVMS